MKVLYRILAQAQGTWVEIDSTLAKEDALRLLDIYSEKLNVRIESTRKD